MEVIKSNCDSVIPFETYESTNKILVFHIQIRDLKDWSLLMEKYTLDNSRELTFEITKNTDNEAVYVKLTFSTLDNFQYSLLSIEDTRGEIWIIYRKFLT